MKLTNSNGFLVSEVTGGGKSCSEYIFLKKSLKYCSTVKDLQPLSSQRSL